MLVGKLVELHIPYSLKFNALHFPSLNCSPSNLEGLKVSYLYVD